MDMISELPDFVLLYILSFLSTHQAVQTSVLSKRWKNMWKYLSSLIPKNTQFQRPIYFNCFINKFLIHRDHSSALHKIVIAYDGYIPIQVLTRLFKYGMAHNVETIAIDTIGDGYYPKNIKISNIMHGCRSIKHLILSLCRTRGKAIISETLYLPELTYCCLKEVGFSSNGNNGPLDPFSRCKKLTTLIIDCCSLMGKTKLLVSNDKLSELTLQFDFNSIRHLQIKIHTPNLKSFIFVSLLDTVNCTYPLFEHDLKFLEEVSLVLWTINRSEEIGDALMSWLKNFSNVYSMTLASTTVEALSRIPNFCNIQEVCFRNLESLIVKTDPIIGAEFPKEVLQYLLNNSRCNEIITTHEELPLYYGDFGLKVNRWMDVLRRIQA